MGCNWIEQFVDQDSKEAIASAFTHIDDDRGFPHRLDATILHKDGSRRLITWHNTPSFDSHGKIIGITMIGEDVTERSRAEEKLHKLSHAVEQSPSIVQLTNRSGVIEYVNPKFTEVTGYEADEVVGKKTNILKSGETNVEVYAELWQTVLNGNEWRGEFHNKRKNGELYWESASISPLRNKKGDITHFVAVKEDITERKWLQQEIEQRNQELVRAETLANMGRMATMIAHDLRNPLSSVKMGMQILKKQSAQQEGRELADIGLDQIRYMEEILTDMLSYAKPGQPKLEHLHISEILNKTIINLQARIDETSAKIHFNVPANLPDLFADANRMQQLFSNLLVNALQSSEENTDFSLIIQIEATYDESKSTIVVSICDNGSGLDDAQIGKLFEPFYTTRAKGTGLGLAIVQQIISQHNGEVSLTANKNSGTCAIVSLPVTH